MKKTRTLNVEWQNVRVNEARGLGDEWVVFSKADLACVTSVWQVEGRRWAGEKGE